MSKFNLILSLIAIVLATPLYADKNEASQSGSGGPNITGSTVIGIANYQVDQNNTSQNAVYAHISGHAYNYYNALGIGGDIVLISGRKENSTVNDGILNSGEDHLAKIGEAYLHYQDYFARSKHSASSAYVKAGAFYPANNFLATNSTLSLTPSSIIGTEASINHKGFGYTFDVRLTTISSYIAHNDRKVQDLLTPANDKIDSVFALETKITQEYGTGHIFSVDLEHLSSADYLTIQKLELGYNYKMFSVAIGNLSSEDNGTLFKRAHGNDTRGGQTKYVKAGFDFGDLEINVSSQNTDDAKVFTDLYQDAGRDSRNLWNYAYANEQVISWNFSYNWADVIPGLVTTVYSTHGSNITIASQNIVDGNESETGAEISYHLDNELSFFVSYLDDKSPSNAETKTVLATISYNL